MSVGVPPSGVVIITVLLVVVSRDFKGRALFCRFSVLKSQLPLSPSPERVVCFGVTSGLCVCDGCRATATTEASHAVGPAPCSLSAPGRGWAVALASVFPARGFALIFCPFVFSRLAAGGPEAPVSLSSHTDKQAAVVRGPCDLMPTPRSFSQWRLLPGPVLPGAASGRLSATRCLSPPLAVTCESKYGSSLVVTLLWRWDSPCTSSAEDWTPTMQVTKTTNGSFNLAMPCQMPAVGWE